MKTTKEKTNGKRNMCRNTGTSRPRTNDVILTLVTYGKKSPSHQGERGQLQSDTRTGTHYCPEPETPLVCKVMTYTQVTNTKIIPLPNTTKLNT